MSSTNTDHERPHTSHWGAFRARREGDGIALRPYDQDPDPSPLLGNIPLKQGGRIQTDIVGK